MSRFDPLGAWALNPQVAVRREPFGALAYDFGTRRLSFIKDNALVEVVESLDRHDSAIGACRAAGVTPVQEPSFMQALQRLADTKMICPRDDLFALDSCDLPTSKPCD